MKRYRVYGHVEVTVTVEVDAESEEEAYKNAKQQLDSLNAYAGNGGLDKLVGVEGDDESVSCDYSITYDDVECLGEAEDEDLDDEDDD